ncbi:terminase [Aggregicoccus sp. 17bor-14]|uniref:terminase n=1 Tax=Myxococcaceae TaxID=31 RepID=UPI00129CC0FB|nr:MULTISPECIES: terminase [Myxococcaceae]MBF5041639.1 terminase [Simulacricoccus sp. 17bor-14]MRI87423.1 terminase [Aggregicoccus sp. 17bor-14]
MREGNLLSWQWSLYPEAHRTRRNLVLHALTAPLFIAGTSALALSPFLGVGAAAGGLLGVVGAAAAQGRGHAGEPARPAPFRGPGDVVARLFVEQWVTFPRFVLSGGFARAWREAS